MENTAQWAESSVSIGDTRLKKATFYHSELKILWSPNQLLWDFIFFIPINDETSKMTSVQNQPIGKKNPMLKVPLQPHS